MAILIKKLDGTVEFTVSAEDFTVMREASESEENGLCKLPNDELVAMYHTTEVNKDTILGELVEEHGADAVNCRLAVDEAL